jgi:hypothetical protein
MSKKYSFLNLNGDTQNDEKSCNFITDANCLGQDKKNTQLDVNSTDSPKNDKTSSDEWKTSGSSAGEGKGYIKATPEDNIPDNNR